MPYLGNTAASRFVSNRAASVYSGDGSTVAFTLEQVVTQDEDILVSVDGVIQEPSVGYAVSSGTTLTFTAAPSTNSGNNIFVYYLASQAGTVGHPSTQGLTATTGTFTGNTTMAGTLAVSGNADLNGDLDVDGTTNLDVVDIDGAVDMASTLAVAGVVTANAGVVIDEMTLDADTLTATDTFTIDAVDDITLDAASTLVRIKHNGTQRFIFNTDATPEIDALGGNFTLHANTSDADIIFTGNDGGAAITALTLDMSAGGLAIFNAGLAIGGTGAANTLDDYEKGTWTPTVTGSSSGSYALDSGHKSTYIKVGNICHVSTSIGLGSLTGTASGFAVIGGFPFNYNGGVSQSTGAVFLSQVNLASTVIQTAIMQDSSGTANTYFLPSVRDNDASLETALNIMSASTSITFSFSYQTV